MSDNENPFARKDYVNEPGIVGASWWNESLASAAAAPTRRSMLVWCVALMALPIIGITTCSGDSDDAEAPDVREERRLTLAMQQDYGWWFGAPGEPLTFTDDVGAADPTVLARLATSLEPSHPAHVPFFQRTLLQAPDATPRKQLSEPETPAFAPLKDFLRAVHTPQLDVFADHGKALAMALTQAVATSVPAAARREALIVDLPGAIAVAYAAGAAAIFDPVLLFDNWPHPRGVVPSHRVLATLLSFEKRFASARKERLPNPPPMFVLASERLTAYSDSATQFDNRYYAKLPDAAALTKLGITRVNYLVAGPNRLPEADDLNESFLSYRRANIAVRALLASEASPLDTPPHYEPVARQNDFKTVAPGSTTGGVNFGTVPVMVGVVAATVVGARIYRNGSWNRVSTYGGG